MGKKKQAMKRGGMAKKKAVKKRGGGMLKKRGGGMAEKMMGGGMVSPRKKMAMGMMGGGMAGKKKQAMKKGGVPTAPRRKQPPGMSDKAKSFFAKARMARTMKPTGRINRDDIKRAGKLINKRAKGK